MRTILLIAAASTGILLAGCADEGYYGGAGYGAGYGYAYSGPADVWYDGYYGPYSDGYWDTGGVFYYRDNGGQFRRDSDGHFRRDRFEGSQKYRASPHRGDRDRDRHGDGG